MVRALMYMHLTVQNHRAAAMKAAQMHYDGNGVSKSASASYRNYQIAASLGDGDAHNALGILLEDGVGCTKDLALAAEHYEEAARLGSMDGHFNLASMLAAGIGVAQDRMRAVEHYRKADALGHPQARKRIHSRQE